MKDWLKRQLARLGLTTDADDLAETPIAAEALGVLLVDDTPTNLDLLVQILKPLGYRLSVAKDGPTALTVARRMQPALVLLDVMMPQMDGFEVCRRLKEDPELKHSAIIFCSALTDVQAKVRGLQLGAVDFITKPFEAEEVIARVSTHLAVQQLAMSLHAQNKALRHELEVAREYQDEALKRLSCALLGSSPALRELQAAIASYAQSEVLVLLHGAPSCGDEAVARAMHGASPRQNRPFIMVDCSRLTPDEQAGIFVAAGPSPSKVSLARGGTLYLEHAQYLSPAAQDRLEALFATAPGSAAGVAVGPVPAANGDDVRVIVYSSLEQAPFPAGFRTSLLLVLGRDVVRLPSLAERQDDIMPIATAMLEQHARRLGKTVTTFEAGSARRMRDHDWPGNLRELEDVVVRSLATASSTRLEVDPNLLQAGKPLGSYRLLEKIGSGAMGEVWKARHQMLARPSAVKLIRQEGVKDAEAIERFRREATVTASLASPHTVTLFDFGVSDNGDFYYVMELLDGIDLENLVKRFGPLEPERAARFLIGACKSLAEAHDAGLVHRDIKPSNLFACRLGLELDFLKVLDFGLARRDTGPQEKRLTQAGKAFGTPEYMAPEVITGVDINDGRTDMYSLGAAAYHMLVGAPVFEAPNVTAMLLKHVNEPPPPITARARTPDPLARLIMRCLSKDVELRPTAVEMWAQLEASGLPERWSPSRARAWWTRNPA